MKEQPFEYNAPRQPIIKLDIIRHNSKTNSNTPSERKTEPDSITRPSVNNMNIVSFGNEEIAPKNDENIDANTEPSLRIRKKIKRKAPAPKPPSKTKRRESKICIY